MSMTVEEKRPAAAAPVLTLPASYYTEPGVFAAERERIFARNWILFAHLSQLREPGDFVTGRVAEEPLVVLRDGDGVLRGFYNVCRHRGHLLLAGSGNRRVITCPYHAWAYGLDGRLRVAPNSEHVAGFDKSRICLKPVRVETLAGFVFVNLDREAESLKTLTGTMEEEILGFAPQIADLAFAHRSEVVLEANWKVAIENFSECYHCAHAHPTFTSGIVEPTSYRITALARHHRHLSRARSGAAKSYAFDEAASPRGGEFLSVLIWPLSAIEVYPGGIVNSFLYLPESGGRTRQQVDWYFPESKLTPEGEELIEQHCATTLAEDVALCNAVQQGLASRSYDRGVLMVDAEGSELSEHAVAHLQRLVLEALEG